jgi:ubiquinone/menaquinone biosynthesis C-methylase UbiE
MADYPAEQAVQRQEFIASEGDHWFARNREALRAADPDLDPVLQSLADLPPLGRVLEIGCADGWRLEHVRRASAAKCFGIDPSASAIAEGNARYPQLSLLQGTADSLPFPASAFDIVVFGFCLYLCDPADHFRIAAEADRVLRDDGWIVVYDFLPPMPWRNPYAHRPGLFSYKMDFARMFSWHPAYRVHSVRRAEQRAQPAQPDDRIAVTVLRRSLGEAFPDNPYRSP